MVTDSQLNHFAWSKRSTSCTREDLGREHRITQCVTPTLDVYQVCHYVGCCVKNESCSYQGSKWKSMDNIVGICYHLNKMLDVRSLCRLQQFCLSARQCTDASSIQHSPTAAVQNSQLPFPWAMV